MVTQTILKGRNHDGKNGTSSAGQTAAQGAAGNQPGGRFALKYVGGRAVIKLICRR